MIDPTDRLIETYQKGDADIMPGAPTGGPWGEIPESNIRSEIPPQMFRAFSGQLTVGTGAQLDAGERPEYWVVKCRAQAGIVPELTVYSTDAGVAAGVPVAYLSAGQQCTIAAESGQYLYILSTGTDPAYYTAWAVRGHLCIVNAA